MFTKPRIIAGKVRPAELEPYIEVDPTVDVNVDITIEFSEWLTVKGTVTLYNGNASSFEQDWLCSRLLVELPRDECERQALMNAIEQTARYASGRW